MDQISVQLVDKFELQINTLTARGSINRLPIRVSLFSSITIKMLVFSVAGLVSASGRFTSMPASLMKEAVTMQKNQHDEYNIRHRCQVYFVVRILPRGNGRKLLLCFTLQHPAWRNIPRKTIYLEQIGIDEKI